MNRLSWKHTGSFSLSAFLMDFSSGMFLVALPYLAMSLGADSLQLGTLAAVRGGAYVVACIPVAFLSDKYSRRIPISVGSPCVGAVLLLMAGGGSVRQLLILGAAWGVALACFWPVFLACIGDAHEHGVLSRATGIVNVAWSLGAMAGGALAGLLFRVRPPLAFLGAALPALLAGAVIVRHLGVQPSKSQAQNVATRPPGGRRLLVAGWLGNASACSLLGLMGGVFPKLGERIGVESDTFGLLMALMGLTRTAVFFSGFAGHILFRDWKVSALAQIVAATLVATVCRASAHWWLALVFAGIGLSFGTAFHLSLYRSLKGEGYRGLKTGVHEAVLLSGLLAGSIGGALLAHLYGLRAPYVPVALLVSLLTAAQVVLNLSAQRCAARARAAGASVRNCYNMHRKSCAAKDLRPGSALPTSGYRDMGPNALSVNGLRYGQ